MLRALSAAVVAYGLFLVPAGLARAGLSYLDDPWRLVVGSLFFCGWLGGVAIFFPVFVDASRLGCSTARDELAGEIEAEIDAIGELLGVTWTEHLARVEELLAAGDHAEARQVYHRESSAGWNELDKALDDWRGTVVKEKLADLRRAVEARSGAAT